MWLFSFQRPYADIRAIGPQWAAACAAVHAQSFGHPWSAAEFEVLLAGRDVVAEAAILPASRFRQPRLAGFVLSRIVLDEAEILTIAVAAKFRRQGIGGRLLAAHLASLARRGAKTLFLEVETGNFAALALYAGFGFTQVGERKAYYRKAEGGAAAALVLRRELR